MSHSGAGRRLKAPEPDTIDDSICEDLTEVLDGERPRPQGSSPVDEYPETDKYPDIDKQSGGVKKGRKSFGNLFEKRSPAKMSQLESRESGVIVKMPKETCAEGLVVSGGGKEGIFIKAVRPESPAAKLLSLHEGDQILSATVYFDDVTYEDALQILEHAHSYKMELLLKRKPLISSTLDSEPDVEVAHVKEESSVEMREHSKTKRHADRISWPKFPNFSKNRKSHFKRSHSNSEADDQRKLELSPTTSDTESPLKSQDAVKSKTKKHALKLPNLKIKDRKSKSVEQQDQDTDIITFEQEMKTQQTHDDINSLDGLESTAGETPQRNAIATYCPHTATYEGERGSKNEYDGKPLLLPTAPDGEMSVKGLSAASSGKSENVDGGENSAKSPLNKSLHTLSASFRRARTLIRKPKEKQEQENIDLTGLCTLPETPLSESESTILKPNEREQEYVYTLPETPLSVMQISQLIEDDFLDDAHPNLLSLRQEFQREREECTEEASSMELARKKKDLSILYGKLQDKVKEIVRNSTGPLAGNMDLLLCVARVIQEEEKREAEPGGMVESGGWQRAWREAVSEGVQDSLKRVILETPEQNPSWLAVHLGRLGQAIREDLEKVKGELQDFYPPGFNVFSTYVNCYHVSVSQHLKKLQPQVTDLKDYYFLLNWIINCYESETIMTSPTLRPEMEAENPRLPLEEGFLDQLKEKYCMQAKEDLRALLSRMLELENKEKWLKNEEPKEDDQHFLNSEMHMDIWREVQSKAVHSRKIDANLEVRLVCSCLEELQQFPKRFEIEFRNCCNSVENRSLWADYQITYINSFAALKEHMETYEEICPNQVEHLSRAVDGLVHSLVQGLEDHYKKDVRPYLSRMLTRKWLSKDEDFQHLYKRTENLSQQSSKIRSPYAEMFVSSIHHYVVKEYVAQLMTNNYTCKNRKNKKAATKMMVQWDKLHEQFEEMKTSHDRLRPVIEYLSGIIGEKNVKEIKNHLKHLVTDYPDISKKHLMAVLYFRGLRGGEKQEVLQHFTELKEELQSTGNTGDKRQLLFRDMQMVVSSMHHYVVKEYVAQLMTNIYT
ncbi:hypothetical protein DPEC_G00293480 [Dallia pectoralis]|uniref:Uncharacterized protein n=1 Tax=Dallia pectoralis TaxID=75939 RepID=A0ACC2FI68_DALPE|nr:hypothetical protein DPEC_G00293480 [Dallia pectoralis]